MSRTTRAILSKENLLNNIRVVRRLAPQSKVIAMIKANAYGHGIRSIALRLKDQVDILGVASIDEALAIRKVGVTTPILLMEGFFHPSEIAEAAHYNCQTVFHSQHQIEWLRDASIKSPIQAWIKFDSGMGRLGFLIEELQHAYQTLVKHPLTCNTVPILSHLACASQPDSSSNEKQLARIHQVTEQYNTTFSICNSAAIVNFPNYHFDFIRPGISLYGIGPHRDLKPVMTLQAQLIAIKDMKKGQAIGYGHRYHCNQDKSIGIVSLGYGDGYPQNAPCSTPTLLKGKLCPIVGQVSMDMITIDLGPCRNAKVGDWVTLWGDGLPVSTIAEHTHSSAYELATRVQNRVAFEWLD